jgi:hypothetical protein
MVDTAAIAASSAACLAAVMIARKPCFAHVHSG